MCEIPLPDCSSCCPENKEYILTLTSTPGVGSCKPYECEITFNYEGKEGWECWTHYRIDDGETITAPELIPEDKILNGINRCILGGTGLTINLILMSGINDPDPCVISETAHCDFSCCEMITPIFSPIDGSSPYCCWTVSLSSANEEICPSSEASISVSHDGMVIYPNLDHMICLQNTDDFDIEYTISVDGEECQTQYITLECDRCSCPEDYMIDRWLTVDLENGGGACGPENCSLNATLDIDEEFEDCFTHYKLGYYISHPNGEIYDGIEALATPVPIGNGQLAGLPDCIPAGDAIEIVIELSNGSGSSCKFVTRRHFCKGTPFEIEECDPIEWQQQRPVTFYVDGCDDAFTVYYSERENAENGHDVQIDYIRTPNSCSPMPSQEEIMQAAVSVSIDEILRSSTEPPYPVCSDHWRIFQHSCWSVWALYSLSSLYDDQIILPCIGNCCIRKIRVCVYEDKSVYSDIDPDPANEDDCTNAMEVSPGQDWTLEEDCQSLNCDIYEDIHKYNVERPQKEKETEDFTRRRDDFLQQLPHSTINDNTRGHYDLLYKVNYKYPCLELLVARSKFSGLRIVVYDLLGNEMKSTQFDSNGSRQTFTLDVSDLPSGAYIYQIIADGFSVSSDKFVVVK